MRKIIFTDLDGTLLDAKTYSFQTVLSALKNLRKNKIPIVFCTAKTMTESEYFRKKLLIKDPFIVENGGAVYIPRDYFSFPFTYDRIFKNYFAIEPGISYNKIRNALEKIRKETGIRAIGFGDMSSKEVSLDSGLPLKFARLAKKRKYDETLKFIGSSAEEKILEKEIKKAGLKLTHGGRYYSILGENTDKGRAVKILTKLFKKEFGRIKTLGLGDSLNDASMLKAVDIPILVQNKEGIWNPKIKIPKLRKVKGIGPKGWVRAIRKYVI